MLRTGCPSAKWTAIRERKLNTVPPGGNDAVPCQAELRLVPSLTTGEAAPSRRRGSSPDTPATPEAARLEQAYQRLKQDIMSGAYSPNERLVEARLTRVLGVSRNTLRTVLVRLQRDGLVILEPNRGGRVRAFSLEEAHDLLRVREVLEGLTAALAATRATPEQHTRLGAVFAAMERALAA